MYASSRTHLFSFIWIGHNTPSSQDARNFLTPREHIRLGPVPILAPVRNPTLQRRPGDAIHPAAGHDLKDRLHSHIREPDLAFLLRFNPRRHGSPSFRMLLREPAFHLTSNGMEDRAKARNGTGSLSTSSTLPDTPTNYVSTAICIELMMSVLVLVRYEL
jgi:hypothetical protein